MCGSFIKTSGYDATIIIFLSGYLNLMDSVRAVAATFFPRPP